MRKGASALFFDIMVRMQTARYLKDSKAAAAMQRAAILDVLGGMGEAVLTITSAVNESVASFNEMTVAITESRIEFEKFYTSDVASDLEAMEHQIISIGEAYGFAAEESLEAGARMAQMSQVLGQGNVGTGTRLGMTFGLIGGMETEEAMKKMINLHAQTGFMYGDITKAEYDLMGAREQQAHLIENTTDMMDTLNSVENTSVATMEQIIHVMNQYAAQAHLTGESLESMAAQSAVLIEAGEEQGKAGRALRMIYARLGGDIGGANQAMSEYVATQDATTGAMRPLSDIISELGPQWDKMNEAEKQALAQQVAGNRHYVRFIKLMENRERLLELEYNATIKLFPAMEERDRRLQDEGFQLKIANTELENRKKQLGEELLPAQIKLVEIETAWAEAMRDVMATGHGKWIAKTTVHLSKHLEIYGGFFNAYMNVQGLIMAVRAYHHVLRSMKMDMKDFYNVEAFGRMRSLFTSQEDLRIQEVKLWVQERAAEQAVREHTLQKAKNASAAYEEDLRQKIAGWDEYILMQEQAALDLATHRMDIYNAYVTSQSALTAEIQAEVAMQTFIAQEKEKGLTFDLAAIEAQKQVVIAEKVKLNTLNMTTEEARQYLTANTQSHAQLKEILNTVRSENAAKTEGVGVSKKATIEYILQENALEGVRIMMKQIIALEEEKLLLQNQAYHFLTLESNQYTTLKNKLGNINMSKQTRAMIEKQLEQAAQTHLVVEEQLLAAEFQRVGIEKDLALVLAQRALAEHRASQSSQQNAQTTNAAAAGTAGWSQKLMMLNMGLMSSSMLMGMFDHSAAGAKAQMMAMTVTVGITVIEMVRLMKSLQGVNISMMAMAGWLGVGIAAMGGIYMISGAIWPSIEEDINGVSSAAQTAAINLETMRATAEKYQGDEGMLHEDISGLITELEAAEKAHADALEARDQSSANFWDREIKRIQTALGPLQQYNIELMSANQMMGMPGADYLSQEEFANLKEAQDIISTMPESAQGTWEQYLTDYATTGERISGWDAAGQGALNVFRKEFWGFGEHGDEHQGWWDISWDMGQAEQAIHSITPGIEGHLLRTAMMADDWDHFLELLGRTQTPAEEAGAAINDYILDPIVQTTQAIDDFASAREELFYGGRRGAMTGALYRQVIQQGVGVLYNKQEVIVSNQFHGFFNPAETADLIYDSIEAYMGGGRSAILAVVEGQ